MISILYEDNHCLAVDKPAGMLTQGDATGDESLLDAARADLRKRYQKPGNVFVGLLHRLDRPVSGVVLLAKTSKAAARLSQQFRESAVRKRYWAVVEGRVAPSTGRWEDWLEKDGSQGSRVVAPGQGRHAITEYWVLDQDHRFTLLELHPLTGRAHQLRVQLASRGRPIAGDTRYGAKTPVPALDGGRRIGLHAFALGFTHPTHRQWLEVFAQAPADWPGPPPGLRLSDP